MKVICPVCGAVYNISRDRLPKRVSKGACRKCGAVLLVNRDTGDVEVEAPTASSAAAPPQDPTPEPSPAAIPVKEESSRDRLAIGVLVAALIVLVVLGFFLIRGLSQYSFRDPLGSISKWFKDLEQYGTELLGDTKKSRRVLRNQKKRTRRKPGKFRQRPEPQKRSFKSGESHLVFAESLPASKAAESGSVAMVAFLKRYSANNMIKPANAKIAAQIYFAT